MSENHYCFNNSFLSSGSGRIHVPLAIYCNLNCNYCSFSFNKNITRQPQPGSSSHILRHSIEIRNWLSQKSKEYKNIKIIGIAGPGDPLANIEQLKEFFDIVNESYQDYVTCICTSGLDFKNAESLILVQKTLGYITFTINTRKVESVNKIYKPIFFKNFDAEKFIEEQEYAVKTCIKNNLKVKINCVYLPTINDDEILNLFNFYKTLGVQIFNIIKYKSMRTHVFSSLPPIDTFKYNKLLSDCKKADIKLLNKCYRCKSDVCGSFI